MRSSPVLCAFLAVLTSVAAGCGDDGGSPDAPTDGIPATAYAGFWIMTSLTLVDEGTPFTLVRDGMPQGLRADAVVGVTGAASLSLDVRQAPLVDGLLVNGVGAFTIPVALEPDRWLLTDPDGALIVLTATLSGDDHLVLALHPDDPRTTAQDPPREIVLDRAPPWSTSTVGDWDLVSLTNVDGTITAGACIAVGSMWATMTMDIRFTSRLLLERVMTTRAFSDDACTTQTGQQTSTQTGYAEEEGGATLRMWGVEGDLAEYLVFSLASAGDTMTLTRTACLPQPDCEDSAPTGVVVRRAP